MDDYIELKDINKDRRKAKVRGGFKKAGGFLYKTGRVIGRGAVAVGRGAVVVGRGVSQAVKEETNPRRTTKTRVVYRTTPRKKTKTRIVYVTQKRKRTMQRPKEKMPLTLNEKLEGHNKRFRGLF